MNLIRLQQVTHHYGIRLLLDGVTLHLTDETKLGLIGVNGTGKSTLLRIIAGETVPEAGEVIRHPSLVCSMVDQDPVIPEEMTVLEAVLQAGDDLCRLVLHHEYALQRVEKNPDDPERQRRLITLQQRMDAQNGWDLATQAKMILTRLGLTDFHQKAGALSGGQRRRIALAGALIRPSNLLILDEPTNHLDLDMIEWLENYLMQRKGALVMVTHDRYFLDRVVNAIVELEEGMITHFSGNYQSYLAEKEVLVAKEAATQRRLQTLYRQELAWIRRGARARNTKQKARIERFEQLTDSLDKSRDSELEIPVLARRLGKKVVEMEQVTFSYNEQPLIQSLDLLLKPGEIVGLAGPNGSGKSTLLRLIAGEIEPDSGVIRRGETVRLSFFQQENREMDPDMKVLTFIREAREVITLNRDHRITASQMLERFLFTPEKQWTSLGSLSGGEKRRLLLLRRLMEEPNLLLLDEPTNDLDVTTLAILEDYLDQFPGTVVIASHDRYLLDRLADRLLVFEEGGIHESGASCSEWLLERERRKREATGKRLTADGWRKKDSTYTGKSTDRPIGKESADRPMKFTFREQQDFETIEERISGLEQQIEALNQEMVRNATDFQFLENAEKEKEMLDEKMNELIERWTYLSEKADKIRLQQKN